METQTCFDLERSLSNWRAQGQRNGLNGETLRELESHLRDSYSELQRCGLSADEAWLIASRRLGQPSEVAAEFTKNDPICTQSRFNRGTRAAITAAFLLSALLYVIEQNLSLSPFRFPFFERVSVIDIAASTFSGIAGSPQVAALTILPPLVGALMLLLYFRSLRQPWRSVLIISAIIAPFVHFEGMRPDSFIEAGILLLWTVPIGTVGLSLGVFNGETVNEGLIGRIAIGWWLLIWCCFATRELVSLTRYFAAKIERVCLNYIRSTIRSLKEE